MNPEVTITQFQQIFFRISNIIQDRQGFPLKIGFFRILFRISYRCLIIIIENGIFTNPEITTAQFQQIFFRIAKDFYYKREYFRIIFRIFRISYISRIIIENGIFSGFLNIVQDRQEFLLKTEFFGNTITRFQQIIFRIAKDLC